MEDFEIAVNPKGHLTKRESFDLEFKQSFHYGDSLHTYVRSLVGMANNRGGRIVFGIQDHPRVPIGLTNDKFDKLDPTKLNAVILEYFSSDISYSIDSFDWKGKSFGILSVKEARVKPIICRKGQGKILRPGAIYYRYRGETKEIMYPELSAILDNEREKEKRLWMDHIQKIGSVGPSQVHILDTATGEMDVGPSTVLIDSSVVDKLKFIREGHFVESDAAPALKLVGDVSGVLEADRVIYAESAYPYTATHVQAECGINNYELQAFDWKYKIKGNVKYHTIVSTGRTSKINKYSKATIDLIRNEVRKNPDIVAKIKKAYSRSRKKG
ncbi:putative DNA binding domain-containing protein [Gilvimarinus sp. SDUM040013]|uniref:DNA binding domain-containing protein n=1 Tax=Gilvimarinus gilvus TaxID=3058038 RepID=A0ABU4S5P1_9GAMM|nr:RNA-binding domain-containing protein [Gilvimarinus sp. SDUM040013]MDO3388006.1 putative DNA binding domain-containing protein [Gilvimarinus sp. SDUM040013]MDX6851213.1 putative DNA binding domain-containing protein [Gilvimarinus sp. SDUM040013]